MPEQPSSQYDTVPRYMCPGCFNALRRMNTDVYADEIQNRSIKKTKTWEDNTTKLLMDQSD